MRYARHWGTTTKPYADNSAIPTTPDGWPTTDFGARMITDRPNMAGMYRLKFTGPTTVSLKAWGAGLKNYASTMLPGDSGLASYTADVTIAPSTQPANLDLAFVGTAGKVRDVQLLRSGVETSADGIFTRDFVERMQRFGVIRFMDWLGTNGSKITTWESGRGLAGRLPGRRRDLRRARQRRAPGAVALHPVPCERRLRPQIRRDGPRQARSEAPLFTSNFQTKYGITSSSKATRISPTRARRSPPARRSARRISTRSASPISRSAPSRSRRFSEPTAASAWSWLRKLGWSPPAWVPKMQLDYVAKTFGPPKNFFYALAQAPYLDLGKDAAGISVGTKTDLTPEIVIATLAKRAAACGGGDYQRAFSHAGRDVRA
jgi:hypothetical protein